MIQGETTMSLKTTFMCLVVEASKHAVTLVVARPVEMLLDSASEFAPNKEVTRSFERHSPLTLTSSHVHTEASHQYVPQASSSTASPQRWNTGTTSHATTREVVDRDA